MRRASIDQMKLGWRNLAEREMAQERLALRQNFGPLASPVPRCHCAHRSNASRAAIAAAPKGIDPHSGEARADKRQLLPGKALVDEPRAQQAQTSAVKAADKQADRHNIQVQDMGHSLEALGIARADMANTA